MVVCDFERLSLNLILDEKTGVTSVGPGLLFVVSCRSVVLGLYSQATKRIRWMPWQSEAMKDVEACDKVRGAGKRAVIRTFLNGETHRLSGRYLALNT